MKDEALIEFLRNKISQLKRIEAMADAVMKAGTTAALGCLYRNLIEQVREEWDEIQRLDRENGKLMKKRPKLKTDSRLPWFNSVYSAFQEADSHTKPPVNSRDLNRIHEAAFEISGDMSYCWMALEKKLTELKSANAASKA